MRQKPRHLPLSAPLLPALALLVVLVAAQAAAAAPGGAVFAFAGGSEARIRGAAELESLCRVDGDRIFLELPGEAPLELVAPAAAADGTAWHPHDAAAVEAALAACSYRRPVDRIEILILPFPRLRQPDSSAIGRRILLSPGARPVPTEVTHMVTIHELGHVFHNVRLAEASGPLWAEYLRRRGIADGSAYGAGAAHADRPREIFAEDFRYLFGGPLANYSGGIENHGLPTPDAVPGLREFILAAAGRLALADERPRALSAANFPNPFNPTTRISLDADADRVGERLLVEVFDASGRRLATLADGVLETARTVIPWDGRDGGGRRLASGVYFARVRLGGETLRHKMILAK